MLFLYFYFLSFPFVAHALLISSSIGEHSVVFSKACTEISTNAHLKKKKKWKHLKPNCAFATSNVIHKQVVENKTPFKKYRIDDIYYGRIIKISRKRIKVNILCDRKAYLNTSEYFRNPSFEKYIFHILKVSNIIKVKISEIDVIHKKIFLSIQKYRNEEIYSSFRKKNVLLNATVLDILENRVLLYIAPNVHAQLVLPQNQSVNTYEIGETTLVQIDRLDREQDELYVKPYPS